MYYSKSEVPTPRGQTKYSIFFPMSQRTQKLENQDESYDLDKDPIFWTSLVCQTQHFAWTQVQARVEVSCIRD